MNKREKLIIGVPVVLAALLLVFFGIVVTYQLFGPSDGIVEFCETPKPGLIKEPANTWSNLGFIIGGIYAAWLLASGKFKSNNNSLTRKLFYSLFYPCMVVFLGPGSMLKHATQTPIGGFFDMLSMYMIASFISAYAMQRLFRLSYTQFATIYSFELLCCICAHFTTCRIVFDFFGNTAFSFFLGLGILFEVLNIYVRKPSVQIKWVGFSLASLLVSIIVWDLSRTGTSFCDPDSLFQGHAVWHLGTALAAFFLFRYYVSENVESKPIGELVTS